MTSNEDARSPRWTTPRQEGVSCRRVWVTPVDQLLYESWSMTPVTSWNRPCYAAMLRRVSGCTWTTCGGSRSVIWSAWDKLTLAQPPTIDPSAGRVMA